MKYIIGMSIFVAFFLLLLLLAKNTPPASKSIPKIGLFALINNETFDVF